MSKHILFSGFSAAGQSFNPLNISAFQGAGKEINHRFVNPTFKMYFSEHIKRIESDCSLGTAWH